ncbi:hypothetical protein PL9214290413 [Planktothrix tepida PCC 9214]|uniref:Uncharacterized protein n=1 Tax=Planktothrix tepida PCC 9214 TaxID=671072 RepID=A0A1J1LF59_9CYAN|nr:hypothetical protein PL9214290413 [Planktothrix tepida PCC 9214]
MFSKLIVDNNPQQWGLRIETLTPIMNKENLVDNNPQQWGLRIETRFYNRVTWVNPYNNPQQWGLRILKLDLGDCARI